MAGRREVERHTANSQSKDAHLNAGEKRWSCATAGLQLKPHLADAGKNHEAGYYDCSEEYDARRCKK